MAVYIYEKDAFDKMVKVEGPEYRRHGNREHMGDCSFDAFKEAWEKGCSGVCVTVEGGAAIYGLWGWHRYCVQPDGEILFLEAFTQSVMEIGTARMAGFNCK